MAISPIPHWFEGSEYTHKVAACIMKYGPISRITPFARRGIAHHQ